MATLPGSSVFRDTVFTEVVTFRNTLFSRTRSDKSSGSLTVLIIQLIEVFNVCGRTDQQRLIFWTIVKFSHSLRLRWESKKSFKKAKSFDVRFTRRNKKAFSANLLLFHQCRIDYGLNKSSSTNIHRKYI